MDLPKWLGSWPVIRQFQRGDVLGLGKVGKAVQSPRSAALRPRTAQADRVAQIGGDPDSPISRGRLCPKAAASKQLVNPARLEYEREGNRFQGYLSELQPEMFCEVSPALAAERGLVEERRARAGIAEDGEGGPA